VELAVLYRDREVAHHAEFGIAPIGGVCLRLVADISGLERVRGLEFRVLPAGPDMHGVVRVLVEIPERRVVDVAAAKIAEVVDAEDLLHVLGGRVVVVDLLVDGLAALVLGRVAQRVPQRVRRHQRIDHRLAVSVHWVGEDLGVTDLLDHMAKELMLRCEIPARLNQRLEPLDLIRRRLRVERREHRFRALSELIESGIWIPLTVGL
jgi:hypothetical protein